MERRTKFILLALFVVAVVILSSLRSAFIAAAVFIGNFESLGAAIGFTDINAPRYSAPVNMFTVWTHPAAAGYTYGEVIIGVGLVLLIYAVFVALILRQVVAWARGRKKTAS